MKKKIIYTTALLLALLVFTNVNINAIDKATVKVSVVNGENQNKVENISLELYEYENNNYTLIDTKQTSNEGLVSFSVEANKNYKIIMLQDEKFVPGKDIDFIIKDADLGKEYYLNECGKLFNEYTTSMIIYPAPSVILGGAALNKNNEILEKQVLSKFNDFPKDFTSYREYTAFIAYPKHKYMTYLEFNRIESIKYSDDNIEFDLKNNIDYKYMLQTEADGRIYLAVNFAPSFLQKLQNYDYQNGTITFDTYYNTRFYPPSNTFAAYQFSFSYQRIENQNGKKYLSKFPEGFMPPEFNVWEDEKPPIVDPCPIVEVTPLKPTLEDIGCDQEPKLVLPNQEGVTYEVIKENDKYLIKAIAEDGYVFSDDATTEWQLDIVVEKCPVVPPVEPGAGKPGTTNPTIPLPETGSAKLVLVGILTLLGVLGLTTRLGVKLTK